MPLNFRTAFCFALLALILVSHLPAAESATGPGLYLISGVGSGDEKPVFGEPVRVAGEGAAQPTFLADGGLLYQSAVDGKPEFRRWSDGKSQPHETTPPGAVPFPEIVGGKVLAAHRIPGSDELSLVVENAPDHPGESWLYRFDSSSGREQPILGVPAGSRLVAWDHAGRVWLAEGTQVSRHCPACGGGWRRMLDLRRYKLGPIEAFAIKPDGSAIAVVVGRP